MLGRTPTEIGEIRAKRPSDIAFLEHSIIWEAEERYKANKELERKTKSRKSHR